jgi:hypothetical protein
LLPLPLDGMLLHSQHPHLQLLLLLQLLLVMPAGI